eukprot:7040603-Pyramimonas_sp.AAC.1
MAASGHFGTPLTRFVASEGAPPKSPVAGFAWRPRPISRHHRGLHRKRYPPRGTHNCTRLGSSP